MLNYLETTGVSTVDMGKLDAMMRNVGSAQFNSDVLKAAYDADPRIQAIVVNFDDNVVELGKNTRPIRGVQKQRDPRAHVKQMAKNAVDLKSM